MLNRTNLNPYIKSKYNSTPYVMLDVIIALMPLVIVAFIAFGWNALLLIGISVLTALLTEIIFSTILLKRSKTILDGSAVVTGLLLAFTLSPATPWYIVTFGAFTAILFGKILWGGLGKNLFNPALVGREFMVVFFASAMSSSTIWKIGSLINIPALKWENDSYFYNYLGQLFYKTGGALGEYSIVCLVLGGLYLLYRNRINWYVPTSIFVSFIALLWIFDEGNLKFSTGGILLGAIFMATDMPSSPVSKQAKIYYGLMMGIAIFCFIAGDCRYEYMSYSILLMNAFSGPINRVFKPRTWGEEAKIGQRIEDVFLLTLKIGLAILAILSINYYGFVNYLIFIYIAYIILKFNFSVSKQIDNVI